jgi:hypothetical protein
MNQTWGTAHNKSFTHIAVQEVLAFKGESHTREWIHVGFYKIKSVLYEGPVRGIF